MIVKTSWENDTETYENLGERFDLYQSHHNPAEFEKIGKQECGNSWESLSKDIRAFVTFNLGTPNCGVKPIYKNAAYYFLSDNGQIFLTFLPMPKEG